MEINIQICVEDAGPNLSAYSPDLLGCVATGATYGQVESNFKVAAAMHLEGMLEDNVPLPRSHNPSDPSVLKVFFGDDKGWYLERSLEPESELQRSKPRTR